MRFSLILLLILTALNVFAQKNASVSGTLVDSTNHKNVLSYSTVSIYNTLDSGLVAYKLSDDKGNFKISGLSPGTDYRLVVNAWQYSIHRRVIRTNQNGAELSLDTLFLSPQSNTLGEVVVFAERPPIVVRKDTIEFNAEAFKTLPSAVVDDLLKKLPGVSIDENGNFLVNGKKVSRILVDGKEFFGGDQQIARKNLPANIIDKVQVSPDQLALRRDPDLSEADIPQVINLKLKKAIKKGAFGKVYAGGGTSELYNAGAIMNFFRDTTQLSVLAYGNNINQPGFAMNDVMRIGGFQRSGVNSMSMNTDGGYALNGVSFGGTAQGVQASQGAGLNLNTITKGGLKLNGQYFFGRSDGYLELLVNDRQSLSGNQLIINSNKVSNALRLSHNVSAELEWKIDSLTELTFRPSARLTSDESNGLDLVKSRNESNSLVNESENSYTTRNNRDEYGIYMGLWKDFVKKGRKLSISLDASSTQQPQFNYNNAFNRFYNPDISSDLNQLRDNSLENKRAYLSLNYSEPLTKKLSLDLRNSYNYLDNLNALYTYYQDPLDQNYDILVPNLSETVSQQGNKIRSALSLNWKPVKDLLISPELTYNRIDLRNEFENYPAFNQNFNLFAPGLMIRYKSINFDYRTSIREPEVRYIQPVGDNTNPLFVQLGNRDLNPAVSQTIYINTYKYDPKKLLNYNFYLSGTKQKDAIIMSRTIDQNGVQTTRPINGNGVWTAGNGGNVTKDFKTGKNSIKARVGYWVNYNRTQVIVNNVTSQVSTVNLTPSAFLGLNLNDVFELNENYSVTYNNSQYEDNFFRDVRNRAHRIGTEVVLRYPKKVVWEGNFDVILNSQKIAGFDNNLQVLNAGVTYLFLKNDRAQLKFSVNDILQSNVRRSVSINANSIVDSQTNNLGRFGLMTLTYNIQNFGEKVGGKQRFFSF